MIGPRARSTGALPAAAGLRRPLPGGFTLLELLIVIGIITILITIVVGVGLGLVRNQKRSVTLSVIRALDGALEEFRAETGVIPRYDPQAYARMPGLDVQPGDRKNENDTANDIAYTDYLGRPHPRRPDVAVFLSQALGYGGTEQVIQNMPSRFVGTTLPGKSVLDCEGGAGQPGDNSFVDCDPSPSIIDAWGDRAWFTLDGRGESGAPYFPSATGRLIYYIHPDNRLARGLYGDTLSNRPYFVSAGPDGLYGLPEECNTDLDRPNDVIHCGDRQFFREQGEQPVPFKQRVLRLIRADNLTSYPIDLEFNVPTALLNPPTGWRPPKPPAP